MFRGAFAQGGQHLGVKVQHVPMQRIERPHPAIGEAMNDFQAKALAIEQTEDAPAAFGAEVKGKEFLGRGHARGPWLRFPVLARSLYTNPRSGTKGHKPVEPGRPETIRSFSLAPAFPTLCQGGSN